MNFKLLVIFVAFIVAAPIISSADLPELAELAKLADAAGLTVPAYLDGLSDNEHDALLNKIFVHSTDPWEGSLGTISQAKIQIVYD